MTTSLPHRTANNVTDDTHAPNVGGVECLCPFCGAFHGDIGRPCRHCGTEDTTAARTAARKRVGPWFVLQAQNPAAPGMTLQGLLALIRQGTVTDRSVIRGPATGQLWRLAGKVRGISREFGACYGCSGDLYAADPVCPHCQRPQSLPADVDAAPEPPVAPPARTDRTPPRQDLLTPRDVAKAFSLGFGPAATGGAGVPTVSLNDLLPAAPAGRSKPTVLAAVTVAAAVACFGWVLIHTLGGRGSTPAVADAVEGPTVAAVARMPSFRPTRPAPPLVLDEPTVRPALLVHSAAAPAPAVTGDEPSVVTTAGSELSPADAGAAADDPKRLLAAALADEASGDYAAAVTQYERIESLSSDEWPAGLKDRLSLARVAARGD